MVTAIQMASSLMAMLSFRLVLKMPGKYLRWSGLTNGVCWLVYSLVKAGSGSMMLGILLASLLVASMRHLSARIFRALVSVLLVPRILPLVPGTSIYDSVHYIVRNSREELMYYLAETLQIAGAVALVVFLMDSVFKLIGKKKRMRM